MRCNIIKIGTSKGIRIPASILKEFDNPDSFEMQYSQNKVILIPQKQNSRNGWNDAFKKMAQNNDDDLVIDDAIDLDLKNEI